MKYMVEYSVRLEGLRHQENLDNQEALLTAFGKWAPEAGLGVLAFVGALTGDRGYVLVEADDPKTVASFVSKFVFWNDITVTPVIDVEEVVAIDTESIAWARAASGA